MIFGFDLLSVSENVELDLDQTVTSVIGNITNMLNKDEKGRIKVGAYTHRYPTNGYYADFEDGETKYVGGQFLSPTILYHYQAISPIFTWMDYDENKWRAPCEFLITVAEAAAMVYAAYATVGALGTGEFWKELASSAKSTEGVVSLVTLLGGNLKKYLCGDDFTEYHHLATNSFFLTQKDNKQNSPCTDMGSVQDWNL